MDQEYYACDLPMVTSIFARWRAMRYFKHHKFRSQYCTESYYLIGALAVLGIADKENFDRIRIIP